MPKQESEEVPIRGRQVRKEKRAEKMHARHKFGLKKQQMCATFRNGVVGHGVLSFQVEGEELHRCNFLRQHFMQAYDQKTPDLKEKSRAALMHLDVFGAHPVSMLFSGAGVPLIGMFQGVASFFKSLFEGEYNYAIAQEKAN